MTQNSNSRRNKEQSKTQKVIYSYRQKIHVNERYNHN